MCFSEFFAAVCTLGACFLYFEWLISLFKFGDYVLRYMYCYCIFYAHATIINYTTTATAAAAAAATTTAAA